MGTTEVWGLTRNRSLAPHVRNQSVDDDRTQAQRAYVSVNPQLHLIRVDTVAEDAATVQQAHWVATADHGTSECLLSLPAGGPAEVDVLLGNAARAKASSPAFQSSISDDDGSTHVHLTAAWQARLLSTNSWMVSDSRWSRMLPTR